MKFKKEMVEVKIPVGYEFVRFGSVKSGEIYIMYGGGALNTWYSQNGPTSSSYIVVRQIWEWPKVLKCRWIAKDCNNIWFGYTDKPYKMSGNWSGTAYRLHQEILDIIFPYVDWSDSLRENPSFIE